MYSGMLALASGLIVLRFLPAIPALEWVLLMLGAGLLLMVVRLYPARVFSAWAELGLCAGAFGA